MQHGLFSSLDSFHALSVAASALLVRDVAGQYRPAEADEVLLAAQQQGIQLPQSTLIQLLMQAGRTAPASLAVSQPGGR